MKHTERIISRRVQCVCKKLIIYIESWFILSKDNISIQERSTQLWVSPPDGYAGDLKNFSTLLHTLLLFFTVIVASKTRISLYEAGVLTIPLLLCETVYDFIQLYIQQDAESKTQLLKPYTLSHVYQIILSGVGA